MAKLPEPMNSTAAKIYEAYEQDAETSNRPHLGASLIGHACERYLWLTFRWAEDKKFPGRMLRLFETGQREEERLVRNLRRIGAQVHDTTPDGGQWRVSDLGGHFGGSMDGAAVGIPEAPKTWHVLEFKTFNDKTFGDLLKNQVRKSKPQHWAQMQTYMGLTGMDRALYMAVNKNTDELYTERVEFDPVEFARIKARAERVITAAEPPLKVSNDPSWYVCKMCEFHAQCHGDTAPQVNCRTCANSTPELDGDARWSCQARGADVSLDTQRTGCPGHRYIPILLQNFATKKDYVNGDVIYTTPTGDFANGEQQGAFASHEIRAMQQKVMLADAGKFLADLEANGIDGRVVA
jgi:hypothetical protein